MQKVRRWLADLPLRDPLERQQASLLQVMLLIILGGCGIGLLLSFINATDQSGLTVGIVSYATLIACTLGGITLLRRGRFRLSVGLAISGISVTVGNALIAGGFPGAVGIYLAMIEREHTHHVIFDITGVPLVDTHVAQVLLQTTTAVRLLSAQAFLVGIRPEVAQTMVALNLDLGTLRSFSTLRDAIGGLLTPRGEQNRRVAVPAGN